MWPAGVRYHAMWTYADRVATLSASRKRAHTATFYAGRLIRSNICARDHHLA